MDSFRNSYKYKKRWKTEVIITDNLPLTITPLLENYRNIFIISDSTVASLHGDKIKSICIQNNKVVDILTFPSGEHSKTLSTANMLLSKLIKKQAKKDDLIIAFGGGVTTDLAGYTAAIFHRGIDFISIPTTLLATVDASIGGKTGVNLPEGKNMAGVYHFPAAIIVYPPFFETLPPKEIKNGWAELIKTAVIGSSQLFAKIETLNNPQIFTKYHHSMVSIIKQSMEIKLAIVKKDPLEKKDRFILNFGHSVGHAIEAASNFEISHGEAVAKGIAVELKLAEELHGFPPKETKRVISLLETAGFNLDIPFSFNDLKVWLRRDKKNRGSLLSASLPKSIGAKLKKDDELPTLFKSEILQRFLS